MSILGKNVNHQSLSMPGIHKLNAKERVLYACTHVTIHQPTLHPETCLYVLIRMQAGIIGGGGEGAGDIEYYYRISDFVHVRLV